MGIGNQAPEPIIHNMSASLPQNMTVSTLEIVNIVDDDNNWFVHEFDNITLIDNAPYVGLRKVDSLIHYLLVRIVIICSSRCCSSGCICSSCSSSGSH